MTNEELLADLRERLDRATLKLAALAGEAQIAGNKSEAARLGGKANGLMLVKGWLRAYDEPSAARYDPHDPVAPDHDTKETT